MFIELTSTTTYVEIFELKETKLDVVRSISSKETEIGLISTDMPKLSYVFELETFASNLTVDVFIQTPSPITDKSSPLF